MVLYFLEWPTGNIGFYAVTSMSASRIEKAPRGAFSKGASQELEAVTHTKSQTGTAGSRTGRDTTNITNYDGVEVSALGQ